MASRTITAHLNTCDYADCRHEWISREIPDRCAKCKRRRWNRGGSLQQVGLAPPHRAQTTHTATTGFQRR
jgi:hypothetical protein